MGSTAQGFAEKVGTSSFIYDTLFGINPLPNFAFSIFSY